MIWKIGIIPEEWKKSASILIQKEGPSDEPGNFRPITLKSVPLKIFTACIRDTSFNFIMRNNSIDCKLQKGLMPNVSGTFEHTAHMTHTINQARKKQRSVMITLLDLKHAFGEVQHDLIIEVFKYHHIPEFIQTLISNLYTDFYTTMMTSQYQTPFIRIEKGMLQGDCLSPLLFNVCFNTFLQYVKSSKFQQLGYKFNSRLAPYHWFQFANQASVVTGQENENQLLLNAFTIWCNWAEMIICVDKCKSFGITKSGSTSKQFMLKLFVKSELIPTVEIGKLFKILGRYYNYDMDDEEHKKNILETARELLHEVDSLPAIAL